MQVCGNFKRLEGNLHYLARYSIRLNQVIVLISVFMVLGCLHSLSAQEVRPRIVGQESGRDETQAANQEGTADVIKINTRVVFLDALVKDARTNEPVRDLSPANFQVLDDSRLRELSYFTREGDSRRPLAMLLFIDIWSMYGRSNLRSTEAMRRMASALTKLAPVDKVAVMTTWIEEDQTTGAPLPRVRMVEDFTSDRARTTAALLSIPELIKLQEKRLEEIALRRSVETGFLRLEIIWRLSELGDEIIPIAAQHPKSQFVVVGLHDDLFDLRKGEREETIDRALRAGITFNGMVFKTSRVTKFFLGTLNKVFMSPRGLSIHAAEYMAERTGGEVAWVGKPDDLASGLEQFIKSLMARYSLGFTLTEGEKDDGRLHQLQVKVRGRDSRGKERKFIISARRGYYMPAATSRT